MGKLTQFLSRLWRQLAYPIIVVIVGFITGIIFDPTVGFFTTFGLMALLTLFVFGRQIYWWVTKTGDYYVPRDDDDKEG